MLQEYKDFIKVGFYFCFCVVKCIDKKQKKIYT